MGGLDPQQAKQRAEEEAEARAAAKRSLGTPVTPETFAAWKQRWAWPLRGLWQWVLLLLLLTLVTARVRGYLGAPEPEDPDAEPQISRSSHVYLERLADAPTTVAAALRPALPSALDRQQSSCDGARCGSLAAAQPRLPAAVLVTGLPQPGQPPGFPYC